MPTRRDFIKATFFSASTLSGASALFAADGVAAPSTAPAGATPVVDTHVHCFAGDADARFPYHRDGPYAPAEPSTPEQLLACMTGAGVDYAVVVHPEPYQDDHRYLEHCLTIGKGKLRGTVLLFAEREDTPKRLRELASRTPLAAARVHAYNPDRLPPFRTPGMRALWATAADLGLAMQLHFEPRYAPGFEPYIKEFKGVPVLVDHLGRPFQGTAAEHDVVLGWPKFSNVIVKLSAVPERGTYPHRDPGPVIKRLTEAFGADRLMYGGGFGPKATPASYRAERERVRGYLAHLSLGDQAKVMGGTAARALGFKVA